MLNRLFRALAAASGSAMAVEKTVAIPMPGIVRLVAHGPAWSRLRMDLAPEHAAQLGRDLTHAAAMAAVSAQEAHEHGSES